MRDSVLWYLFEHMMEVLNGNSRAKIGQKAMNFFMMIGTLSAQAQGPCTLKGTLKK